MNEPDESTRTYSNGDITVVWQARLCQHSQRCFRELPTVFNPKAKPWVTITGAPSGRIAEQIERCPSGALSYVTVAKNG